jgi:hypothetical protein
MKIARTIVLLLAALSLALAAGGACKKGKALRRRKSKGLSFPDRGGGGWRRASVTWPS